MGLLHKNLILASIASVAMVGFLGSSSASALDGFSFSDIIRDYRNQTEQLKSYLTNPFGSGCEATNPDSTISCNETSFPNLLFNGAPNNSTWGHEGKGLVFVNNNNLVEGNPQLATAKRGDALNYSMEIKTQRYNDEAMANPVTQYVIYAFFSEGLAVNQESVVVKVANQTLDASQYQSEVVEFEKGSTEASIFGGAGSLLHITLPWTDGTQSFVYNEDAVIAVTYSAAIADDAPSEVFSRGAYITDESNADFAIFTSTTDHQATASIDGNILIRRVDASGNPLAGAKYTVDGVKANIKDETNNIYVYDENGAVSEFSTDANGKIIITGVPMGDYDIREVSSPDGHMPESGYVRLANDMSDSTELSFEEKRTILSLAGSQIDITDSIMTLDDGTRILDMSILERSSPEEAIYDEESGLYNTSQGASVKKVSDGYELSDNNNTIVIHSKYDSRTDMHYFPLRASDFRAIFDPMASWLHRLVYLNMNDDGTITYHYSRNASSPVMAEALFLQEEAGDCYTSVDFEGEYLCPVEDGWILSGVKSSNGSENMNGEHFVKGEESNRFHADGDFLALEIKESEGKILLNQNLYVISRYARYNMDFMLLWGYYSLGLPVTFTNKTIPVKEVLFKDMVDNNEPEAIINPQTGDAVIKTIIIAAAGLAPIIIIRKRLTRR